MKISVINGSPRKNGNGSKFLNEIIAVLKEEVGTEVNIINLSKRNIGICRGCQVCYKSGESFCPIKDDVEAIKKELLGSDGIIFYSPTYVVNMSGLMKNFIDRLSYVCHRPAFYGKTALILTTTGSSGGAAALKALKWPAIAWGLRVVKSFDVKMAEYNYDQKYKVSVDRNLQKLAHIFLEETKRAKDYYPGFIELAGFNARKQNYLASKNVYKYDVEYWREKGWLDRGTKYYFPLRVGKVKYALVQILTKIIRAAM